MKNTERRSTSIDKLLAASLELLCEKGYARFRSAEVAERSGMSQGSVFRYFPTKMALIEASLERSLADHLERLASVFASLPAEQRSRRTLMLNLWAVLSHREFAWTYEVYAAAAHDDELRTTLSDVLLKHRVNVDELSMSLATDMGVHPRDVANAVNVVLWAMQGLVLNDLATGPSGREEHLITYLEWLADTSYGDNPTNIPSTTPS
jgi:AcrR family transcriptional regulator